jgi:hypothetical protein
MLDAVCFAAERITGEGYLQLALDRKPFALVADTIQDQLQFVPAAEIPVGDEPRGCVLNEKGTRLLVANHTDGSVSIIDTKTDMEGRFKITVMPGAGVVNFQTYGGSYERAKATQEPAATGERSRTESGTTRCNQNRRTRQSFFQPVKRPALPVTRDSTWARNGIDHFVLSRLKKEGIAPSAAADRVTLIRRLFLDLLGLPPTPAEVAAFLADASANAYEKLVDRLLDSLRAAHVKQYVSLTDLTAIHALTKHLDAALGQLMGVTDRDATRSRRAALR